MKARTIVFSCYDVDSGKRLGDVSVDLAVEEPPVGQVEVLDPRNRLELPKKVITRPYRLFPVSDQIADKVWATMQQYGEGIASTREKDLVDLVVISRTQRVELAELHAALETERIKRRAASARVFEVPESWGPRYAVMAKQTTACAGLENVHHAQAHVAELVNPGLDQPAKSNPAVWSPETGWEHPR